MRTISVGYNHHFGCNERKTAAQRAGRLLRKLADRIDGRTSLAIEMRSVPVVSWKERVDVLRAGAKHMSLHFEEAVKAEATEQGAKMAKPELWEGA